MALESHSQFQTINNEWSVGGCAAWRGRAEGPGLHFLIFPSFHSGLCAGMEAGDTGLASPLVCSRIFTRTLFRLCFVLPQLALRSLMITLLHPTHYLPLRPGAWRIRLLHNSYFIQCMLFVSYFVVLAVSQWRNALNESPMSAYDSVVTARGLYNCTAAPLELQNPQISPRVLLFRLAERCLGPPATSHPGQHRAK